MDHLTFTLVAGTFSVWQLRPDQPIEWGKLAAVEWYSVTRTTEEVSLIVPSTMRFEHGKCQSGWSALKVEGPLAFGAVGIMAGISGTFAQAGISILAVSTFNTDYVFVETTKLGRAVAELQAAGHGIRR